MQNIKKKRNQWENWYSIRICGLDLVNCVNELVWMIVLWLHKMLTLENRSEVYVGTLYYFCIFSINLKLFPNNKLKEKEYNKFHGKTSIYISY